MKAQVIEISGYAGAFMSLYMTGKNVDDARLKDILGTIDTVTNRQGFIKDIIVNNHPSKIVFDNYMEKIIKYGVAHGHETILDFIKITIFMEDLHRGAQDDFDAHAKRMDIIRSSTRANKKSSGSAAELSDWYKDKILPFHSLPEVFPEDLKGPEVYMPASFKDKNNISWVMTPWGYVREDFINNPDVLRGLVPLGLACDNVSTVSFRNLRHIYDLRRRGTHAAPELQDAVEQIRDDLRVKCPILGDMLGKVWVPSTGEFIEKTDTEIASKHLMISAFAQEVIYLADSRDIKLTREQAREVATQFVNQDWLWTDINECIDNLISDIDKGIGDENN